MRKLILYLTMIGGAILMGACTKQQSGEIETTIVTSEETLAQSESDSLSAAAWDKGTEAQSRESETENIDIAASEETQAQSESNSLSTSGDMEIEAQSRKHETENIENGKDIGADFISYFEEYRRIIIDTQKYLDDTYGKEVYTADFLFIDMDEDNMKELIVGKPYDYTIYGINSDGTAEERLWSFGDEFYLYEDKVAYIVNLGDEYKDISYTEINEGGEFVSVSYLRRAFGRDMREFSGFSYFDEDITEEEYYEKEADFMEKAVLISFYKLSQEVLDMNASDLEQFQIH